jgi:hypothetical protein
MKSRMALDSNDPLVRSMPGVFTQGKVAVLKVKH